MNISELIVDLLEKGQKVEIPGIGTLDSVIHDAHHDPQSQTLYPASRTIVYREDTTGDNSIVKSIAESECISEDVAKQMWHNYVDALTDKVKSSGEHSLGRLGKLTCEGKKTFGFTMAEGVVLDAGNKNDRPIANVRLYDHDNEANPFDQFDDDELPIRKIEPGEDPVLPEEPEEAPADDELPTPEPEPESSPAEAEAEAQFQSDLDRLDDVQPSEEELLRQEKLSAREERARLKHKQKAEKEQKERERKAEEERKLAEEQLAKEQELLKKKAEEDKRRAEEELRRAEKRAEEAKAKAAKIEEESRLKAEKAAEKERIKEEKKAAALAAISARENAKAEQKAAAVAEKENERLRKENERLKKEQQQRDEQDQKRRQKEAEQERKRQQKEAEQERKRQQKEDAAAQKALRKAQKDTLSARVAPPITEGENPTRGTENADGKRKRKRLLPLLIALLLLLLIGAAAYLLIGRFHLLRPEAGVARTGQLKDVDAANSLTYNCDMIEYSNREIMAQREQVCRFLDSYINTYLASRNFSNAKAPMMDRIRQYSGQRLGELLGERFAVQRLIPYDDYIYEYNKPFLKQTNAARARTTVQAELMDYRSLDDILNKMADELGLEPGGAKRTPAQVQGGGTAERKAAARKKETSAKGEAPVYVYVEKGSKQGFDVIAGFYLNKATAAKQTAHLHEQGCDAYIIEFNDLYYVSMGSAATQTAADALLKHIKGWYDGDVVIKKW